MAGTDFVGTLQSLAQQNFLGSLVQEASAKAMAMKADQVQQVIKGVGEELKLVKGGELQTTQQQLEQIGQSKDVAPEIQSIEQEALSYQKLQMSIQKQSEDLNKTYGKAALALASIGTPEAMNAAGVLDKQKVDELKMLAAKGEIPERVAKFQELRLNYTMSRLQLDDYFKTRKKNEELQQVEDFIVSSQVFENMPAYGMDVYAGTKMGDKAMQDFDVQAKAITAAVKAKFPNISPGVLQASINTMLTQYGKNLTVKQIDPTKLMELARKGNETHVAQLQQQQADLAALQHFTEYWNGTDPNYRAAVKSFRNTGIVPENAAGEKYDKGRLEDELKNLDEMEEIMNRSKVLYQGFAVGRYPKDTKNPNGETYFNYGIDPISNVDAPLLPNGSVNDADPYKAIMRFESVSALLNNSFEYNPYNYMNKDKRRQTELPKGEDKGFWAELFEAAQAGSRDRFGTISKPPTPTADPNKLKFETEKKAADEILKKRGKN